MNFEKGVLSVWWSNSLNELQNANPFLQSALLCLYKALKTPLIINLVNNKSNKINRLREYVRTGTAIALPMRSVTGTGREV